MFKITTYKDNTEITIYETKDQPKLEELQKLVGGYIEQVPEEYYRQSNKDWFARQHPSEIDAVWVNEEGMLVAEPIVNKFFTPAPWGDSLYGNVVVVEKL